MKNPKRKKTTPLTQKRIIKLLETNKGEIRTFGVKKIGLFGSFASGKRGKKSDIDILVSFARPTFDNYMELKFFLERLFGRNVDLVIEDNLKPALTHVKESAVYVEGFRVYLNDIIDAAKKAE
jgi:predicted nucleotidyltransferase